MPKKFLRKKKAYQAAIRSQVAKGLVNEPKDGNWVRPQTNDAMARDQYNGYRFNR